MSGCNCKKSQCLKKYCECFAAQVGCTALCNCRDCSNSFGLKTAAAAPAFSQHQPQLGPPLIPPAAVAAVPMQMPVQQGRSPRRGSSQPRSPLVRQSPRLQSLKAVGGGSVDMTLLSPCPIPSPGDLLRYIDTDMLQQAMDNDHHDGATYTPILQQGRSPRVTNLQRGVGRSPASGLTPLLGSPLVRRSPRLSSTDLL